MDRPSDLEQFLQQLTASGTSQGEGQFTLAREKALEKLAEFQLPFEGAWSVKVIQSLVASNVNSPIAVSQTRRLTVISCADPPFWDLDGLEQAFFTPQPQGIRTLDHIVAALWAVGLNGGRSFEVSLPHEPSVLLWDGQTMHRVQRAPGREFRLSVTHQSAESSASWLYNQVEASRRNTEVATALRDHCYTCPVPLTIDGRRVDGLHHCPGHGWSPRTFPLSLTFVKGDLPEQPWPSGTFEALEEAGNNELSDGGGLEGVTKVVLREVGATRASGAAILLTAHASPESLTVGSQTVNTWQLSSSSSHCYWIQDGVVVEVEKFMAPSCGVSIGCFVSADGLDNDLTGLILRNSAERARRFHVVSRLVDDSLLAMRVLPSQALKAHNRKRYQKLGNTVLLLALGVGWTVPVMGTPLAMLMGLFGLLSRFAVRGEQKKLLEQLDTALNSLSRGWKVAPATGGASERASSGKKKTGKRKRK